MLLELMRVTEEMNTDNRSYRQSRKLGARQLRARRRAERRLEHDLLEYSWSRLC